MKGIVKLTIALLFVTLLLAACGGSPAANAPTETPAPQENTPTSAPVLQATPTTASYPVPGNTTPQAADTPAGYPAPQATPAGGAQSTQAAYPAPGGLVLVTADGSQKAIDPGVINAVSQQSVSIDGQDMQLRPLTGLLMLIGVTSYSQVSASDGGTPLVLSQDQVGQAYLDVQSDGKIRLVVQGVPQDQWVTNMTTLQVK